MAKKPVPSPSKTPIDWWGEHGVKYLEKHGLVAHRVVIRSRDFGYFNDDPGGFYHYLTRRLGLQSVFSQSKALSHGSWLHTALEGIGEGPAGMEARVKSKLNDRIAELKVAGKTYNLSVDNHIKETREDAAHALCWLRAALSYSNPRYQHLKHGLLTLLTGSQWRPLGAEILSIQKSPFSGLPLCAQFDRLYLNEKTREVWFVDAKTCGGDTNKRSQLFPIEVQPIHYNHVLDLSLKNPSFCEAHDIPQGSKLGGCMHFVINKPSIRLSGKDAPYCFYASSKRSNMQGWAAPLKGKWVFTFKPLDPSLPCEGASCPPVATEKEAADTLKALVGTLAETKATGEPSPINYERRCLDWYLARGEHSNMAEQWEIAPPVNVSTLAQAVLMQSHNFNNYKKMLATVSTMSMMEPIPGNYTRWPSGALDFRYEPSPFAEFYINSPQHWPDIIREKKLAAFYPDGVLDP